MSSNKRKMEIKHVYEEGRQAALNGKHIQTVPIKYLGNMDRYQWEKGYYVGQLEKESQDESCPST